MSDYSNPEAIRVLEALIILTGDPDLGATKALSILRAFERDGTTLGSPPCAPASDRDEDMALDDLESIPHMYPATCASSPAAEPVSEDSSVRAMAALKAEMVERYPSEMVPPLSAYISRVQLQRPDLGKTRCRSLAKMARDAGTRLEDMLVAKAAKRKQGRPRKVTKK